MKTLKLSIISLIVILGVSTMAKAAPVNQEQPQVLYVKPAGTSTVCSGWDDACDLQTALSKANPGDQVWAAAGTYKPTIPSGSSATFLLESGVSIYGGFPENGGAWEERDWLVNLTTLSGDLGIIDDTTVNSYHVVVGNGVDDTAVLDGFTISGGRCGTSGGGGMQNKSGSSPTLTNLIFSNNGCYFGGGMHNSGNSNPALTNVTFSENSSGFGGGMFNSGSSPLLTNVVFNENSSSNAGGGMFNENSHPILNNVTFSGNNASDGGGMANKGSSPVLTNVTFFGNIAGDGGGIYNFNNASEPSSNPLVINTILWGNTPNQIFNVSTSIATVTYSDIQYGYEGIGNINADPLLGPLADNGGFTLTHALGTGSPAVDAGNQGVCTVSDQRGFPRTLDGNGDGLAVCDMGAYEYKYEPKLYLPLVIK